LLVRSGRFGPPPRSRRVFGADPGGRSGEVPRLAARVPERGEVLIWGGPPRAEKHGV